MADTGIGSRIFEARKRLDMRQRDLASAIDVDVMQVSRWERGAATPKMTSLKALARALDVSLDWLTGDEPAAATGTDG